jgi:hypothetical protein
MAAVTRRRPIRARITGRTIARIAGDNSVRSNSPRLRRPPRAIAELGANSALSEYRLRVMTLYTLKVTLAGARPPIWRRIEVPADIGLGQLHGVLQIAMGWTDTHLHQFEDGEMIYGPPDSEIEYSRVNENTTRLCDVLEQPKDRMTYEYDFGDSWRHQIVLEAITDSAQPAAARVVKARGACPPEDVGGIGGYAQFLDAMANPRHEEHAALREWHGRAFDAAAYDIDGVNARLRRLRLRPVKPRAAKRTYAAGTSTQTPAALERFRNKLKAKLDDPAAILDDLEVRYMTDQISHMLAETPMTFMAGAPSTEDMVRWSAVAARCRQARDARGWSTKDAARTLKIPHYRVEAAERGPVPGYDLECAVRYFRLLGIETWISRWARANRALAQRQGLA